MLRLTTLVAVTGLGALAVLTACAPSEPEPTPTPVVSETPEPTLSDAEVEAEAIDVVTRFAALADKALTDHVLPYDELNEVATDQVISLLNVDMQSFIDSGYFLQNSTQVVNPRVISSTPQSANEAETAEAVFCADSSQTVVTDASGQQVPPGTITRRAVQLGLERRNGILLVESIAYPEEPEGAPGCEP